MSWWSSCLDNPTALSPLATLNFFPVFYSSVGEIKVQVLYMKKPTEFLVLEVCLRCYLMNTTEQLHFAAIQVLE